jgi:SepF-like predicted cell division protein (DUF552 family)
LSSLEKTARSHGSRSETSKQTEASESEISKIFLKAMPLRNLSDLDTIKREVKSGNILIIKVSPLANKNIEGIKKAVNELCKFVKTVDGDIARLGEERVVITPSSVRIWREKPVAPQEQVSTAA